MSYSSEILKVVRSQIEDKDKIWVYQSNRTLTNEEVNVIQLQADNFTKQWAAHSKQLQAKAFVLFNLFLVLTVNEEEHQASGCSIDSSVAFVKSINQQFNIDLLQRNLVAAVVDEQIELIPLNNLGENISDASTLVFNNLITSGKEFKEKWITAIENSWHKRFFEAEHS